ncbi:MAG: PIG-L deacetylase family protein [Pseudonocardiaceae bacterium]
MSPAGSVLTVMAHPDDAELWAGGTLAIHAQAGASVTVAVPRTDEVRDQEAAAGAEALGAALRLVDELTADMVRGLLTELRPEVVITHNPDDIHPDHQRTAQTLLTAVPEVVIATGYPRRIYTCDGYHNLRRDGRPLHLPVIVDVTSVWETKMRALAEHGSQPIDEHFAPMAQTLGRLHGGRIGVRYAEAFAPLPILGRLPASTHL